MLANVVPHCIKITHLNEANKQGMLFLEMTPNWPFINEQDVSQYDKFMRPSYISE